jgi:hypothetical protein
MYNLPCLGYNGGLYMDLFEKAGYVGVKKEKAKYVRSQEIFAIKQKEGRASKRYGTKKPIIEVNKKDLLVAWREDM